MSDHKHHCALSFKGEESNEFRDRYLHEFLNKEIVHEVFVKRMQYLGIIAPLCGKSSTHLSHTTINLIDDEYKEECTFIPRQRAAVEIGYRISYNYSEAEQPDAVEFSTPDLVLNATRAYLVGNRAKHTKMVGDSLQEVVEQLILAYRHHCLFGATIHQGGMVIGIKPIQERSFDVISTLYVSKIIQGTGVDFHGETITGFIH